MKLQTLALLSLLLLIASCGKETTPKPNAYLRLEYPQPAYKQSDIDVPFSFEKNKLATDVNMRKIQGTSESYGVNLEYPTLKGTIYLTYKSVENNHDNLVRFMQDAQNFTMKHTQKADDIVGDVYENEARKVYGMFYEVGGNAASQSQFYVTDSVNHFLTGSLYFYAKPNFDSILPAANYLQKDIQHIMETVEWKSY